MRYFKVVYDFSASEPVELTVRKGDLVCASEGVEKDGWIKVELASDTRRRGFVPVTYVKEQPQSSGASHGEKSNGLVTPTAGTPRTAAPVTHITPAPLHSQLTLSRRDDHGEISGNPSAVVEAFLKNEVFFKQLMRQRQDALGKLEASLAEATADVAACKDKNAILARKLRDLDQNTERERRKWRDRIEEEKLLVQRAAQAASASLGTPVASTTVRVTTETVRERIRNH